MTQVKLPKYIQPLRMAEHSEILMGNLALSSFPRLSPLLLDDAGLVAIEWKFGRDIERFYYIQGSVFANLPLECQRCMQAMTYPLQLTISLSPVFSEEAAKKLPARYEPLMLEQDQVDLITVVEDELLLALPMIPKHEAPNCMVL